MTLAELVYGGGTGGVHVSLGGTDQRFELLVRGRVVCGPAAQFFGRLVRLGLCFPKIGREVVVDLTGVTELDLWGFSPLLHAALERAVPFTVVVPCGLVDPWLVAFTSLAVSKTTVPHQTGPTTTLEFSVLG